MAFVVEPKKGGPTTHTDIKGGEKSGGGTCLSRARAAWKEGEKEKVDFNNREGKEEGDLSSCQRHH